ncbi:MAG: VOC family protein [Aggregatilineales bacterium]
MSLPISEQITFLYTRNISICTDFYENILGFELSLDQGGCKIWHIAEQHSYVGMCERATAPEKPEGIIFTIVTPDVDGWYERLTSRGVKCEHAPKITEEYGIYHFFVRDPNGYLLEFQRFLDENWDMSRR